MASAKFIFERMVAVMNRGGDSILKARDIEVSAKRRPRKTRAEEQPFSSAQKSKF
jgi:hypothetical protein